MTPALVSVIVPFHEAAPYLRAAVESVLAQGYRPVEVLLVDDASRDGGPRLARGLAAAHPALRLLRLAANQGPAAARNRGLAAARGDLVTFLDADDTMLPDRLGVQARYLAEHPAAGLVLGGEALVLDPDAPLALLRRRRAGRPGPRAHVMSMMVRRPVFDRVGDFDPAYRVGEDLDWLFRAAAAGVPIGRIDRALTRHRMRDGNLSYRTRDIQAAVLRSLRRHLHQHPDDARRPGLGHHPVR